jgi:hypothetical protein
MKKMIALAVFIFAGTLVSNAQLRYGIKGGLNYNQTGDLSFESAQNTADNVFSGAKAKSGFHVGAWTRLKIPLLGLYVRPELVYTSTKSEYSILGENADYTLNTLDIPVLLGIKTLGLITLSAGPSFQYTLNSKLDTNEIFEQINSEIDDFDSDGVTVNLQFGVGVELGRIGLDLRYETGLSESLSEYAVNSAGIDAITIDNRTDQWIVSLYLKL